MPAILQLVQRPDPVEQVSDRILVRDVYAFDELDLAEFAGINIGGACDQRFLAQRADVLTDWVRAGGRLLVNGHPLESVVHGMPQYRKLDFHSPRDLWLSELDEHPIWQGIDRKELLFNTGVPGTHSFEKLTEIGVAGFYAHAYLVDLPDTAIAITGIGQGKLPVDAAYPLGAGEVVVHLGNDMMAFNPMAAQRLGTAAARLGEQALAYLEGDRALQEASR